ncbi:hypothetical protein V7068_19390 [Bacillus sp. JJ634]
MKQVEEIVYMSTFPKIESEVDDTARLQRALATRTSANKGYRIVLEGDYTISDTLNPGSLGSYCVFDGNNATITMTDDTKQILKT